MPKKIQALADWISASDAAQLLSDKHHRSISGKYIRNLSLSKKQPVRTQQMGNRLLYNKEDILAANIKQKKHNT